jgi:type II secretory pathway component PulF
LAVAWGAIGGIGRGIWFLKENVNDLGFRNSWTGWFLSCPFIGGFFGAVVYFILIAGLISITQGVEVDFNNSLAIIAISVIAGFSWPAALEMMKRVINSLAGSEKQA